MMGDYKDVEVEYRKPVVKPVVDVKKLPIYNKGMSGKTHDVLWWIIKNCSESGKLYAGWRKQCMKDLEASAPTIQICVKNLERLGAIEILKRQAKLNVKFFDIQEDE